jgi:hypothetical protein
MGTVTAPVVGSGSLPAWMAVVEKPMMIICCSIHPAAGSPKRLGPPSGESTTR